MQTEATLLDTAMGPLGRNPSKRRGSRDFPGGPVDKTLPSNAGGVGSIPGWGGKIPHTSRPKNQNIKQKQYCKEFNKDFKSGPYQKQTNKQTKNTKRRCSKWDKVHT